MKLNILERIVAIQGLATYQQGNFILYKTIEKSKTALFAKEEEVVRYNLRLEDGKYKWNDLGFTEEVEIELSDAGIKLIKDWLVTLNDTETLTPDHYSLYIKFVGDTE